MPILPGTTAASPSSQGSPLQNMGLRNRTPPQKPAPPPPVDLTYLEPILGRSVKVRIDAGIPRPTQISIQAKIRRAISLINLAASKLTGEQKDIIHLLQAIVIVPAKLPGGAPTSIRTGIDVYRGVFTLLDTYMTAPGVTPSFFASISPMTAFTYGSTFTAKTTRPKTRAAWSAKPMTFRSPWAASLA